MRRLESGLKSMAGTRLSGGEKMSVILLLSSHARASATLVADITVPEGGEIMPEYSALIRKLVSPDSFPELITVLDEGALDNDDEHPAEFTFGIERILDGIATLV